jgi:hypothetical protein
MNNSMWAIGASIHRHRSGLPESADGALRGHRRQQRLTTFFLLLCALRQRFKGEPQYPVFAGLLSTSYTDAGGNLKTGATLRACGRIDEPDRHDRRRSTND